MNYGERKSLTWRHLKAFNDLYSQGFTRSKITNHPYVDYLLGERNYLQFKQGNHNILVARSGFKDFYEREFKEDFDRYDKFFECVGINKDARSKYYIDDIQTLMFIDDHKKDLLSQLTTIRTFSSEVFSKKGSKYLENRPGLKKAVCEILNISEFPDIDPKNHQWRFVVDCNNPTAIIFCENLAHLKNPWKARKLNIELWYVGGNNIGIVDHISKTTLGHPIYYSCDWDFHGLRIYEKVKEKLLAKGVELILLMPTNYKKLPTDSPHHFSEWDKTKYLSGLKPQNFVTDEQNLIEELIATDNWIEEESCDIYSSFQLNNLPGS